MSSKEKIPDIVKEAVNLISKIPSYGERNAVRFLYNLLKLEKKERINIAEVIKEACDKLRNCRECFIVTDKDICDICSDGARSKKFICVVEEAQDAYAIEKLGRYSGVYHILMGRISPLEGISPQDLTIEELIDRIQKYKSKEVIIATNPNVEGEATANYLINLLSKRFPTLRITRISYGLPFGGLIELADEMSLEKSIEKREEKN